MSKFQYAILGLGLLCTSPFAQASDRDVQIRSLHFDSGLIELHNFGVTDEPLDGWIFCSHDENEVFLYTNGLNLNGVIIEAGTSLFVHFNNDAPLADPDRINRSDLGPFATPFDSFGAYSLSLYINSNFASGAAMADHLQWSFDGLDNATADERSDEAFVG